MDNSKEFVVLYTHQKQKKAKTWHDGILRASCQNKKATLYDEKGSRLDSIYITAGDITLGEQLESDRYYIMVEDVKTVSGQDNSVQQQSHKSVLGSLQQSSASSQRRQGLLSSQGRCSGLKRKGFVPPRMAKNGKLDTDENSSQLSQSSEMGNSFPGRQRLPCTSDSISSLSPKVERLNSGMRQQAGICSSTNMSSKVADYIRENEGVKLKRNINVNGDLHSVVSPKTNYLHQLQKVCFDSQNSNGYENKVKSPWSVYGSNNNSPKALNSPKFEKVQAVCEIEIVLDATNLSESPTSKFNRLPVKNKKEPVLSSNLDLIKTENLEIYETETDKRNSRSYHVNTDHKAFGENTEASESAVDNVSKRSMIEILKLVKGKDTPSSDANTEVFLCKKHDTKSDLLDPSVVDSGNEIDKDFDDLDKILEDTGRQNSAVNFDSETEVVKSMMITKMVGPDTHEQTIAADVNSNNMSEIDDFDMDADPSFAISFSPLSNVTYSDDENEQEAISTENVTESSSVSIAVKIGDVVQGNNKKVFVSCRTVESSELIKQKWADSNVNLSDNNDVCTENNRDQIKQHDQKNAVCEEEKDCSKIINHVKSTMNAEENLNTEHDVLTDTIINKNKSQSDHNWSSFDRFSKQSVDKCITNQCRFTDSENDNMDTKHSKKIITDGSSIKEKGEISTQRNALSKQTACLATDSVYHCSENIEQNQLKNKIHIAESNFIDLIDNRSSEKDSLVDPINEYNELNSEKSVSETSDRKATQSQDTMDYSCDTLSHCSNTESLPDSQEPEIPNIAVPKAGHESTSNYTGQLFLGTSEFSSQNKEVSQQIPFVSETLEFRQKLQTFRNADKADNSIKDNAGTPDIMKYEKNYLDSSPFEPINQNNIQLSHNTLWPANHGTNAGDVQPESILTQIDLQHQSKMNNNPKHSDARSWRNRDRVTDLQLSPYPEFPQTSELYGRKMRKEVQKLNSVDDVWETENYPSDSGKQSAELTDKINKKLGSYKISGSLCSQVTRDACLNRQMSTDTFSPSQSDCDADMNFEMSPSSEGTVETSALKLQERLSVLVSGSESSKDNTPCFSGEGSDEDYIYSQIYKPRPMVEKNNSDATNKMSYHDSNQLVTSWNKVGFSKMHAAGERKSECYDEDSPELFTQPRIMYDKQDPKSRELISCSIEEKVASKSRPLDNTCIKSNESFSDSPSTTFNITRAFYHDKDCDNRSLHMQKNKLCHVTKGTSYKNIFIDSQESDHGSMNFSDEADGENICPEVNDSVDFGQESPTFVCDKNVLTDISDSLFKTKRTSFSDETSPSSQEFAQVIGKSLRPKTEQLTNEIPRDFTSLSKWEKYNSQHSEEDVSLDINAFKVKTKDFSVIEKYSKSVCLKVTKNANESKNHDHDSRNVRKNCKSTCVTNVKTLSHLPFVKKDNQTTQVAEPNPVAELNNVDSLKLPCSFSSVDSFEQMLASDNLDFNDPDLDKLLQTQTNIDKIEEVFKENKEMLESENIRNALATDELVEMQTFCKEDKSVINKVSETGSAPKQVDKLSEQCDKIDAEIAEKFTYETTEKCGSLDRNCPDKCDIVVVENSSTDGKLPDYAENSRKNLGKRNIEERQSSGSETSFSLDDSFLASNPFDKPVSVEKNKGTALSLRAPWKETVTHAQNKDEMKKYDNKIKLCESSFGTVTKLSEKRNDVTNLGQNKRMDNTNKNAEFHPSNMDNRSHDLTQNFMGYDNEDDNFSSIESSTVAESACESKGECSKTSFDRLVDNKSKISQNCNDHHNQSTVEMNTYHQQGNSLAQTSRKSCAKSVSSQFKNPFKNGGTPQTNNLNKDSKLIRRFRPPAKVGSHFMSPAQQGHSSNHKQSSNGQLAGDLQADIFSSSMCGELLFPSQTRALSLGTLVRQATIPTSFQSVAEYKNILTAALTEYLNHQLSDLAKKYHHALSKVDISLLEKSHQGGAGKEMSGSVSHSKAPACQCGGPAKVVQVKKQGPNNGRFFYACSGARNQQCKFFQWLDEASKGSYCGGRCKISDPHSLITHMKTHHVHFYSQCTLVSKYRENIKDHFRSKYAKKESDTMKKKQLYLRLSHKGHSSLYSKDDIWVISQSLDFSAKHTFIAKSTYFGPTSSNEVEIDPIVGYSPSNWSKEAVCHALLVGNASTELSCLDNIREHISPQSPPVIPSLLNREIQTSVPVAGYQVPRMITETNRHRNIYVHSEEIDDLVRAYIQDFHLNEDQAEAIKRAGSMFSVEKSDNTDNILLIHGVFGAGKSFLLSVIVLFLVKVFQRNDVASPREPFPWKLLISSTTNVAVDRILQGLLELGFEDFIRVGSVKKIAKPVLPYSVHATGTDNQELRDFQEMLRSGELTAAEKQSVRQGIDRLRKGENKKKLAGVRVVGVTCASCLATCISSMQFPVVLLDECSQMTEPSSLLPIARFGCEKLLLVGDPKQLDPTIQGSEAANETGLEQTMFDRLIKMGYIPTLLRTQYRCHPDISAMSNNLFYSGMLTNGVTAEQRAPLLPELPTICLYDVDRGQECCEMAGSNYNEQEAQFVVFLIQFLMSHDIEPSSVGVITLYRAQMSRITDLLNTGLSGDCKEIKGVQVSTVDAFQGGERDIIILSTVRTQASGFIDNDKRINVALTRARNHLLIVGNYSNLSKNVLWNKIISHCKGFPNGIQSADETRHQLKSVLEKLRVENLQNEEINSRTPEDIEKGTKGKKSASRRKKDKIAETTSQVSSMSESSARKMPQIERGSGSKTGKRKRIEQETKSPQFSLSNSSEENIQPRSPAEEDFQTRTSPKHKKTRLSDRLNPDLFDDFDKDSSEDDLISFNL